MDWENPNIQPAKDINVNLMNIYVQSLGFRSGFIKGELNVITITAAEPHVS
jgi:hypothetical protein